MLELSHPFPTSVTQLFDPLMVNAPSAWGVLQGNIPGVVAVDSAQHPTWAVGRMHWNLGFAAGQVDCEKAGQAAASLARWGSFGVFRSQNDPDIPGGGGASERLEFSGGRFRGPSLTLPPGTQIVSLTTTLLGRCQWGEGTAAIWGGPERFVEKGLGFCLVARDEILCEVYAFAIGAGRVELSVVTHPDHQGKGYAKLTCGHMAQACEARGLMPTYSCQRDHQGSVAVARSLGFSVERPCRSVDYHSTA